MEKIEKRKDILDKYILLLKKEILINWDNNEEKKSLKRKLDSIIKEYNSIEIELMLNKPKFNENEVIDLRKKNKNKFLIFLHNTTIPVGIIEYKEEKDTLIGNVIYTIYPNYRGNNYAYYALILLGAKLYQNGINDIQLCTDIDNKASIKTIEKYGGVFIETVRGINKYNCKTVESVKNKIY